jgi:hypothetical protein
MPKNVAMLLAQKGAGRDAPGAWPMLAGRIIGGTPALLSGSVLTVLSECFTDPHLNLRECFLEFAHPHPSLLKESHSPRLPTFPDQWYGIDRYKRESPDHRSLRPVYRSDSEV